MAGVCGGIAEYFDIDATLIRVLFVLFGFAVGRGILIYIILWIIMPAPEDKGDDAAGGELMQSDVEEVGPKMESDDSSADSAEEDTTVEVPADEE